MKPDNQSVSLEIFTFPARQHSKIKFNTLFKQVAYKSRIRQQLQNKIIACFRSAIVFLYNCFSYFSGNFDQKFREYFYIFSS